jgi:cytochrome b6-f complex iron-sulfur subunit
MDASGTAAKPAGTEVARMDDDKPSRRSFLGRLLGGTLLAGFGGAIASIVVYLFPPEEVSSALGPQRVKVGKADDILPGEGKLALVDDEPVWVVHLPRGFVGMSAWCTHKGCIVKWDDQGRLFRCPCHEGLFDERGNVVSGLPLRPLTLFRVGLIQGELYVSRGEEHEG